MADKSDKVNMPNRFSSLTLDELTFLKCAVAYKIAFDGQLIRDNELYNEIVKAINIKECPLTNKALREKYMYFLSSELTQLLADGINIKEVEKVILLYEDDENVCFNDTVSLDDT